MSEHDCDVVIVGAGVSGALVAKTLIDQGQDRIQRVVILEAGEGAGFTAGGYRSYVDRYYTQSIKGPNAPYPPNPNAPSANVLDLGRNPVSYPIDDGAMIQYGPTQFLSDYARAAGGTTLHWLGTCLRMLPNDFRMNSVYGRGVDWPIEYDEIRPYYERAEREIGVSADVEDQVYPLMGPDYFGSGYQYPMKKIPQSYLDQRLAAGVEGITVELGGEQIDVRVESTPQGRNSTPNLDYRDEHGNVFEPVGMVGSPYAGQRCEGNSSCTPICPVQAKYNALKTLNAINQAKIEIRTKCVASRVLIDHASGRVSGIEYQRYYHADSPEHTVETIRAKVYVLAAHAIENAKLLLASNAANSSSQVGRNLMDHLCLLTWGLMPENIGAYRGPGSTSGIPSFRDGAFRKDHSSFRVEIGNWGWTWPTGAPNTDVERLVDQDGLYGPLLRKRLREFLPRQFRIAWEAEQLPSPGNCVSIDSRYRDALGNFKPVISYHISDYTRAGVAAAKRVSDQINERLGITDYTQYDPAASGYFEFEGSGFAVNGAGHVVGTHRMGSSRHDSVVDKRQRSWDHENLYLVGCGNMATLGTSNPTLTAAALSIWAGENILRDLSGTGC